MYYSEEQILTAIDSFLKESDKADFERLVLLIINVFQDKNKTYVDNIEVARLTSADMITNMCKACELFITYKDSK